MSFNPLLVRRLEELGFNAWPALRTVLVGGWVVRLADGPIKKANAASPFHPQDLPTGDIISLVDDVFDRAGLEPIYRLTGLQKPDVEPCLRDRGYADQECIVVLRSPPIAFARWDDAVDIAPQTSRQWLNDALNAYGCDITIDDELRRLFGDIVWPCGFATVRHEGRDVAWGLAVTEADHVGLFDLVVASEFRGRGFGRRLVSSLLQWGRRSGATRAYLQVLADNAPARALYRSLGFAEAYTCRNFARLPS